MIIFAAKAYALSQIPQLSTRPHRWLAISVGAFANSQREFLLAAAICAPLALIMRDASRPARLAACVVATCAALALALLNLSAAELLRTFGSLPSVGLLIYSDILFSSTGRSALLSWIPIQLAFVILATALLTAAALWLLAKLRARLRLDLLLAAAIAFALFGSRATYSWSLGEHIYRRSPTLAFLKSFSMLKENPLSEQGGRWVQPPPGPWEPAALLNRKNAARIKNVILVVIESGAAAYFDQYGGRYQVTPTLSALPNMLQVDRAYAQAVSSTQSLGVLLSSTYPSVSLQWQRPSVEMLPHVLSRHGWETGFFYSSDTRYHRVNKLLDGSGFAIVRDFRARRCADAQIEDVSEFNSQASSDACTFADLEGWIERVAARPFFAMVWTFQTHYPYFTAGGATPVVLRNELTNDPDTREMKARYLTALREADRLIHGLVVRLDRLGLRDKTLIIITGDHGESFLQHGSVGHGNDLYEESVRVPLFIVGPQLSTQRFERLTGHVDIAPTITDVLGVETPPDWAGRSLFRASRTPRVYFSTPWTDLVVGYRQGSEKVVGRLIARKAERYDLRRDPAERTNLAAGNHQWQKAELDALAGWARSVRTASNRAP